MNVTEVVNEVETIPHWVWWIILGLVALCILGSCLQKIQVVIRCITAPIVLPLKFAYSRL